MSRTGTGVQLGLKDQPWDVSGSGHLTILQFISQLDNLGTAQLPFSTLMPFYLCDVYELKTPHVEESVQGQASDLL